MPHPTMFRDDDPVLAEVRAITLRFPEAFEKVSHGRPAFFVSKMFAMYGGSTKPATKGADYIQYPQSIMVKVDDSDRRALEGDKRFSTRPIWGLQGGSAWISPQPRKSTGAKCANWSTPPTGSSHPRSSSGSSTKPDAGRALRGSIGTMSFASPFPDVEIPNASVYEYLFGNIDDADADRIALVDAKTGDEISYRGTVGKSIPSPEHSPTAGSVSAMWSACWRRTAVRSRSPFTAFCAQARRPPRSTCCSRRKTSPNS